ncbi:MAG: CooT family nickel-binding protein [Desulfobacteraceae bacterium]|nr:CooT family nickel-binding protein [Desulfobacteraceae bacterium]
MCDINAFVLNSNNEEKIMENVDVVETQGEMVKLINIFGETKTLQGRIVSFDNSRKKMVLAVL